MLEWIYQSDLSEINWGETTEMLLSQYEALKLESDPSFAMPPSVRLKLRLLLEKQLRREDTILLSPSPEQLARQLPDGRFFSSFKTEADGSCGFHALLGEQREDGVFACDAAQKREEFCDWLQARFDLQVLPEQIEITFNNYFDLLHCKSEKPATRLSEIDKELEIALKGPFEGYHKGYTALSHAEKDKRKEQFVVDRRVFAAYKAHMQKSTTWLTQPELAAVAECFNKRFYLCQSDWSGSERVCQKEFMTSLWQTDPIYIWYQPGHYERAFIVQPN